MEWNSNIMYSQDYLIYQEGLKVVKQLVKNHIKKLHQVLNQNLNHKNHNPNKLFNLEDSLLNEYMQILIFFFNIIFFFNHQILHQMLLIFHQLIFYILLSICEFKQHFFYFFHTIFLYKSL